MSKCRIIDRLAYTKGVIQVIGENEQEKQTSRPVSQTHEQHGEICPECGKRTFFPEAGCWNCKSCGYSYCDVRR